MAIDGVVERLEAEHRAAMNYAWRNAWLGRVKKMPPLDEFIKPRHKADEVADPNEGLAAWAAHQTALNKKAGS